MRKNHKEDSPLQRNKQITDVFILYTSSHETLSNSRLVRMNVWEEGTKVWLCLHDQGLEKQEWQSMEAAPTVVVPRLYAFLQANMPRLGRGHP